MNEIFWIKGTPPAPLAIVIRPRGDEWLEDEMLGLKRGGLQTIVSLLERKEALLLGLDEEHPIADHLGLKFLSYPIPDTQVPSNLATFQQFVTGLADRLRAGEKIGVHCRGSIGRATVTAACALIHLGWTPRAAIAAIQAARGCMVPDTQEQEDWILRYKAKV